MNETTNFPPYKVLVRVDDAERVVEINSSAFITNTDGWVEIDSGMGDKFHHAQGNYMPGPLMDERGVYRYKLVDGKVVERTAEEMDADYVPPEQRPTTEQRVDALETTTDDIILMMAELIGG
ncbi:MAG: hypothetical protein SOY30_16055 [Eubacteriales bacterium]|nr:hypothetical protein [Eubacteriales bacterium]